MNDGALTTDFGKKDLSLLVLINIIAAVFGCIYLALIGMKAGTVYTILFTSSVAICGLTLLFVKDIEGFGPVTQYIKIPIISSLPLTAFFYLAGQIVGIVLVGIIVPQLTSLSIPLYANDFNMQALSVEQAEVLTPPWLVFIVMFAAGNIETFVFNFATVVIGILIGHFIYNLAFSENQSAPFRKTFVIGFAMLISIAFFTIAHTLNDNYNTVSAYIFAGGFLLISNLSIYIAGFLIAALMGFHQMNNLVVLIQQNGGHTIALGFASLFGVLFLIYEVLIFAYVIKNRSRIWPDLTSWLKSITN